MMSRSRIPWPAWLCLAVLTVACSCSTLSLLPPSSSGTGSASQDFPLTPNPLNVQITLDTANAVTNKGQTGQAQAGVVALDSLEKKFTNGIKVSLRGQGDYLTQAADGTYSPAFGTAVTIIPVSAIGGIPFSKGYVAAFQLGPEGLLMSQPDELEMDIPGDYNDLVGFASNGDGTDFHLVPIFLVGTGGGTTSVYLDVMHFSMYGVAEATAAEVTAQQAHPPSTPDSQDDDLLAAPKSKKQLLTEEHERLLKSAQVRGSCNETITTTRAFFKWYGNVQLAGLQDTFKDAITADSTVLLTQLRDCLKDSCKLCLQNKKPDKDSANALLVQANLVVLLDTQQSNAADANYYRELANKCAKNAGLKQPSPHVAECQGSSCGPTPTTLACPAP
jgi:hypothetical protein